MNIAFIIYPDAVLSGTSNGVRSQAISWSQGLIEKGCRVDLISAWGNYDWTSYDLIHIYGSGLWLNNFLPSLVKKNKQVVISPIIDSNQSYLKYKLATKVGIDVIRLYSNNFVLAKCASQVKAIFVRSNHEAGYFIKSLGLPEEKVVLVKLGVDAKPGLKNYLKEDYCLHVSSYTQPRKNVKQLIKACQKINKRLVVAGNPGSRESFQEINDLAKLTGNVEVLGFQEEDALINLYRNAKVFCLPSLYEGVGLAALEAAVYGCDVVITNRGGPVDYFQKYGFLVNPESVNSIANGISQAFASSKQPNLREYIMKNHSINMSVKSLYENYIQLIEN